MFRTGLRIGDYRVDRRLRSGATCDVYEASHAATGEKVAIKSLRPNWCAVPELLVRFLNEASFLQQLDHPNVIHALRSGTTEDGWPYVMLEWLPLDLHHVLERRGGRLAHGIAAGVGAQLAGALVALHNHGLIHRDMKPANVLVARDEPELLLVKLTDLGLAKRLSDSLPPGSALRISTAQDVLLGTLDYMAPEQCFDAKHVGPKADVYALGVLLFQMLAGRLPFIGKRDDQLMYLHLLQPPPLEYMDGHVPPELAALVARMLAKVPASRPAMRGVLEQLRAFAM